MSLCCIRGGQTMRAAHAAPLVFVERQRSLRPVHACPGLHLWPLGDSAHGNQSPQELAQVRSVAALQSLKHILLFASNIFHFPSELWAFFSFSVPVRGRNVTIFHSQHRKGCFFFFKKSGDSFYHYFPFPILNNSIILCVKSARSVLYQYPHTTTRISHQEPRAKWFECVVFEIKAAILNASTCPLTFPCSWQNGTGHGVRPRASLSSPIHAVKPSLSFKVVNYIVHCLLPKTIKPTLWTSRDFSQSVSNIGLYNLWRGGIFFFKLSLCRWKPKAHSGAFLVFGGFITSKFATWQTRMWQQQQRVQRR